MVSGVCLMLVMDAIVHWIVADCVSGMGLTLVCSADDPSRRVTDAQVQHFTRGDELIERGHHFFDGSAKVPPVDIQLISKY